MTTEEKLQHFLEFCMEDARTRSAKMLDEYTDALEAAFREHRVDATRRAEMQVQLESEKIERDINKQLSIEQINIKRTLGQKQEELKEELFVELKNTLACFMETPEYFAFLEKQISDIKKLAGDDNVIIYMDPADEAKLNRLSMHNKAAISLSEYSFSGGIRAVIPERHILIDNSFQSKLEEEKRDFRFDLGLASGGTSNV